MLVVTYEVFVVAPMWDAVELQNVAVFCGDGVSFIRKSFACGQL